MNTTYGATPLAEKQRDDGDRRGRVSVVAATSAMLVVCALTAGAVFAVRGGDASSLGSASTAPLGAVPACLNQCSSLNASLVTALKANPIDCDGVKTFGEPTCVFEKCDQASQMDILKKLMTACPNFHDPDASANLGRRHAHPDAAPTAVYSLGWNLDAKEEILNPMVPIEDVDVKGEFHGDDDADDAADVGIPGSNQAVAPRPPAGKHPKVFEVYTSCISDRVRNKFPAFFNGRKITGAKIAHHNFGSTSFFDWRKAPNMISAASVLKCVSTKLGLRCPKSDGKFFLTTDEVNYEYSFVLQNDQNKWLYETGKKSSPFFGRNCRDAQMHHPYFNRVMTLEPDQNVASYVFGECNRTCEIPPFSCPEGTWYLGGECVVQCPPRYGGFGDTDSTRKCAPCPAYCNTCDGNTCRECSDGKYLHDGQCHDSCPSGTSFGGTRRVMGLTASDFDEFAVSADASTRYSQPVFVDNVPMVYFGHGYGASGTADPLTVFRPPINHLNDWTEAWIGARIKDTCGNDKFTASGSYCVCNAPGGTGGANCCTSYGKVARLNICAEVNGTEVCKSGGFNTQKVVSGSLKSVGMWNCGDWFDSHGTAFPSTGRYNFLDIPITLRMQRDGTVSCWRHNMFIDGVPTAAPDYTTNVLGAYDTFGTLTKLQLEKTGGWAEGGALMRDVTAVVKTSNSWAIGRVCE